jgi:hypothetical protein
MIDNQASDKLLHVATNSAEPARSLEALTVDPKAHVYFFNEVVSWMWREAIFAKPAGQPGPAELPIEFRYRAAPQSEPKLEV